MLHNEYTWKKYCPSASFVKWIFCHTLQCPMYKIPSEDLLCHWCSDFSNVLSREPIAFDIIETLIFVDDTGLIAGKDKLGDNWKDPAPWVMQTLI